MLQVVKGNQKKNIFHDENYFPTMFGVFRSLVDLISDSNLNYCTPIYVSSTLFTLFKLLFNFLFDFTKNVCSLILIHFIFSEQNQFFYPFSRRFSTIKFKFQKYVKKFIRLSRYRHWNRYFMDQCRSIPKFF